MTHPTEYDDMMTERAVTALERIAAALEKRSVEAPEPIRPAMFTRNGQPLMIDADRIYAIRHQGGEGEGKALVCYQHPGRNEFAHGSDFVDEAPAEAVAIWEAARTHP